MTEAQKERKRAYDREYSKKYYEKHKEKILKNNSSPQFREKRREYEKQYRERTRLKVLAHIHFNAYKAGKYIVTVNANGEYYFDEVIE